MSGAFSQTSNTAPEQTPFALNIRPTRPTRNPKRISYTPQILLSPSSPIQHVPNPLKPCPHIYQTIVLISKSLELIGPYVFQCSKPKMQEFLPWRRLCRCLLLRAAHVFPQVAQEAAIVTIGCGKVWSCVVWVVHDSNLKSKMKGTGLTDTRYISTYFVRKGYCCILGASPYS